MEQRPQPPSGRGLVHQPVQHYILKWPSQIMERTAGGHIQPANGSYHSELNPDTSQNDSLVGGWATPLKNTSSSIGMISNPIYGKIKMATKPPTSSIQIHGNLNAIQK